MYRATVCPGACSLPDLWDYASKARLLCADFRGSAGGEGDCGPKTDGQRVRMNNDLVDITLTGYA